MKSCLAFPALVLLSLVAPRLEASTLDEARNDFAAHKPIPGLPDLSKPVFIKKDSLVCSNPSVFASGMLVAAASGSSAAKAVIRQNCAVVKKQMQVQILIPEDGNQYVLAHMSGYVGFVARSANQSDASITQGWVYVSLLTGGPPQVTPTDQGKDDAHDPALVRISTEAQQCMHEAALDTLRTGNRVRGQILATEIQRCSGPLIRWSKAHGVPQTVVMQAVVDLANLELTTVQQEVVGICSDCQHLQQGR